VEHRYAQRKAVELKVWLSGARFENQPARVRNLSLGSTTDRVVQRAACPVLIVR
jgi:nucleotide-binding universal stress UspA family protein